MRAVLVLLILSLPIHAEDWTVKGKVYPGVKVLKVEADTVTFLDSDGGACLELADMPHDLQKRFRYDPVKGMEAAKAREEQAVADGHALQAEMDQADARKLQDQIDAANQIHDAQEAAARASTARSNYAIASRGGTIPVAVDNSAARAEEDAENQKEWATDQAIRKDEEAHGYAHAQCTVLQVVDDGFLCSIFSRYGFFQNAFVRCDTRNMFDGQAWIGIVTVEKPYKYVTALGAAATVPGFTTDLTKASTMVPATPAASFFAPRRPVSSLTAVGGG
jgi:hypothetical protein